MGQVVDEAMPFCSCATPWLQSGIIEHDRNTRRHSNASTVCLKASLHNAAPLPDVLGPVQCCCATLAAAGAAHHQKVKVGNP